MNGDIVIPYWQLPKMSQAARRLLGQRHQPRYYVFPDDGSEPIPLDPPVCVACGEAWKAFGCSTMLALATLSVVEHDRDEAEKKVASLTGAVNALGVKGAWWRDQNRETLTISLKVEEIAIRVGGVEVIDQTLIKLRNEMRAAGVARKAL